MKLLRALKWAAAVALLLFSGTCVYFSGVVLAARQYTAETVLPAVRTARFPLAVSDLTPRQLHILLAVQDPGFYRHSGVDLCTPGAGLTTITQSLVKKLYFENFEPGLSKLRQTLIAAYALDPMMTKDEQLTAFLNMMYLGNGATGFAEASAIYFGKPFAWLSEDEYISLVAMIIAPAVFDLKKHPERNAERSARIRRLADGEYTPKGLMDLYYGSVDEDARKDLPPVSYFPGYYQ
ncbi:MAG: biosynthetic peptidoglycan transglycosylase [Thermodesulfobacteriota bacterium]